MIAPVVARAAPSTRDVGARVDAPLAAWHADGLAHHLHGWALQLGADAAVADELGALALRLAQALQDGHVCLPLAGSDAAADAELRNRLLDSGVVGTPGAPDARPLVLDDALRLYLHRQFDDERRLARRLRQANGPAAALPDPARTAALLEALFAGAPDEAALDGQKLAVALALQRRLLLVSGGPGTGKTSTVVQLLACLLDTQPALRVALVAPTGKAAARLGQAVRERADRLPAALRARLPDQASTVHRLLGVTPAGFLHHRGHRLALDLLVVDEASMLDLALARRLLEAVPDGARIVLLGDKDQLAAVEAGAVFAEASADPSLSAACRADLAAWCGRAPPATERPVATATGALPDSTVWFSRSYRFAAGSGIARLAAAVRESRADDALALLRKDGSPELGWIDDAHAGLGDGTRQALAAGLAGYLQAVQRDPGDAAAAAAAFERFRVLCALRDGPRGVNALNRWLEAEARSKLASLHAALGHDPASPWYAGRTLLVLRNDAQLQLYNGDVGFVVAGTDGRPQVAFAGADGRWRHLPPHRLPPCETAFAMTVHKSQGSEFDEVLLVLPAQPSRVLGRELLYTAVTRARRRVVVSGPASVVAVAVNSRTQRASGLLDRLREAAG